MLTRPGRQVGRRLRRWLPEDAADVARIEFSGNVGDLHLDLTAEGPFDLIVDTCAGGSARARFVEAVNHLRVDGSLVMRLPSEHSAPSRAALVALAQEVSARRAGSDLGPPHPFRGRVPRTARDLHALAYSLSDLEIGDDFLRARLGIHVLPTVNEPSMNRVLARRPSLGDVVSEVAAGSWPDVGRLTASEDETPPRRTAPPLYVRSYRGVTCAHRSIAIADGIVVPDTFRNPGARRPTTPALVDWAPHTVLSPEVGGANEVAGTWFHLDNCMRGHFGHAMTEQLSKTWAWEAALDEHPDLRGVVFTRDDTVAEWEYQLLEAAGVPRDRVVAFDEPVVLERLITATPAYVIGEYVHPVMREIYSRVGRALAAPSPSPRPDRLFLTRHDSRRGCRNTDEVEQLFAAHGFAVIAPEEHGLIEQVSMVRDASVVAGWGGSGMVHLALADTAKRVLVISSENYHLANEKYLCAMLGHELTLVRSPPDIARGRRFSSRSFHSPFTLDLHREGLAVLRWLDDL